MVSESEWKEWKQHPATLALMHWLDVQRDKLKDAWEMGDFTTADFQSTCLKNAENVGRCDAFMDVQELTYQTIEEDLNGE